MSLKSRFARWLVGDTSLYLDTYFEAADKVKKSIDDRIEQGLQKNKEHLYELNRTFARVDDDRWANIKEEAEKINKRVDMFFERQHCTLCRKIAGVCEKENTH